MSFNVAVSSIATGLGFTVYGGYKYLTACQKPNGESNQQKKHGLGFAAAGVAAIAVGAGVIYSGATTNQTAENPFIPAATPTISEVASTIEKVASCPIDTLRSLLNDGGKCSLTAKTFNVLDDTQGISCDNFLPWRDEFNHGTSGYIDGIKATHLEKPAMWGIDQSNRPFIAIKYLCDQTTEGVVAIFQRFTSFGARVVSGGHFKPAGCYLGPLEPAYNRQISFLGNLTTLLKGENVVFPNGDDDVSKLTLSN